jgi:hypothetical protein
MFLNRTQLAATLTGLAFVISIGSLSGSAIAQTAQGTAQKQERHPELRAALRELKMARSHLQKGAHDFGGERAEALNDTDKAITEVEQALKKDQY